MNFEFSGHVSASKSLFNRALIIQSFQHKLQIQGSAESEDVEDLIQAMSDLRLNKSNFHIRAGGTTLRFLLARLSRKAGIFEIEADSRLLERPHQALYQVLKELGTQVEIVSTKRLKIISTGWPQRNLAIKVDSSVSSQFASALLLAGTDFTYEFSLELLGRSVSRDYFLMTKALLEQLGIFVFQKGNLFSLEPLSQISNFNYVVEPDMSNTAALSVFASLFGTAVIKNWTEHSLQPDAIFLELLTKMGVKIQRNSSTLIISKSETPLKSIEYNFSNCPDLVPLWCVFCSQAYGASRLSGISHLKFKESDRIKKTVELVSLLGVKHQLEEDTITIFGNGRRSFLSKFTFDPDQDHRMVMAARFAQWCGATINILNTDVVKKSFDQFMDLTKIMPERHQ